MKRLLLISVLLLPLGCKSEGPPADGPGNQTTPQQISIEDQLTVLEMKVAALRVTMDSHNESFESVLKLIKGLEREDRRIEGLVQSLAKESGNAIREINGETLKLIKQSNDEVYEAMEVLSDHVRGTGGAR